MTNIFKVLISFIFLTIFSFSIANAKVRWCVVHNMTGKISTCFSNKLQCDQFTKNLKHYSCVAR